LAENNVDIAMPWFVFQDDPLQETIVDYLAALSKKKKKPILLVVMVDHILKK